MKNPNSDTTYRSFFYKLLASGFNYPDKEFYEDVKSGKYWKELNETLNYLNLKLPVGLMNKMKISLSSLQISFENFESEYIGAFETNLPKPSCSLYEGHFVGKSKRPEVLLEIKAFYKNFGLFVSEEMKEPEDHLKLELEFMHFLTFKEYQAKEDNLKVEPYRRAQKDFLGRHLSNWIPLFRKDVEQKVQFAFYRYLSFLLDNFIFSESRKFSQ